LKIHFPKTNSHSGFFVTIVVVLLLLLLLLFQQDETNVKIFLPVATATDKNTSLHCQLPSPFPLLCFALLACLVVFLETQKKNKNANFPSQ
jgi:cell division protein FtsW (lipid II flippase)